MFKYILTSFRGYRAGYLKNDIIAGIIVAALTIPVAMGYAGVAGLPPIYGLYASMLPVIGYILFASSPQLIFGADASASAITGSCLATLGIAAASTDAVAAATLLSLFTGLFLIVFAVLKLGRFSEYISRPVISGFISGTAILIIVEQIPKILGISSGDGFFGDLAAVVTQFTDISLLSLLLGGVTVFLILVGRKILPKFPVALVAMVIGTILSAVLHLDQQGISVIGDIPSGLPPLTLPDVFGTENIVAYIGSGLMIAIVIFADSLMSAESFATKNHYKLKENREIFAFGVSSLCASITGCSPTSASVSRTAASEQFHGKTQMVSVVAVIIIGLVVLFLGSALYYMPQPVLGGIVFAALLSVVEISVVRGLMRTSRNEAVIWIVSAIGVLAVGTLFGVIIGVVLSFIDVIIRITKPPQAYLGVIEGKDGYFDLDAHKSATPIPGVLIYRFSARLMFANAGILKAGIMRGIEKYDPKTVIIDGSGINGIDSTAAEEIQATLSALDKKGIKYYFAGQTETLNKQLQALGIGTSGDPHFTKTINDALAASGTQGGM